MRAYTKKDFPVADVRRFLEPGPIVLVSSRYKAQTNIMTMGWHMVMEFEPSRLGCFITTANHSYELIRRSRELVINVPEVHMMKTVIGIGNCHGSTKLDKFRKFDLTAEEGAEVSAPLIKECYANFECKVVDTSLLRKYGLFILECVKAHVPAKPKYPKTMHYRGEGVFMLSGANVDRHRLFKKQNM